jgi:hypothetical protein
MVRVTTMVIADHVSRRCPSGGDQHVCWSAVGGLGNDGNRGQGKRGCQTASGDVTENAQGVLHFLDEM